MNRISSLILVVVLMAVSACGSSDAPEGPLPEGQKESKKDLKGQIRIGGAYALFPMLGSLAEDFMQLYPDVKIEVERTASGEGTKGLIDGRYQLAMISSPLTEEEISAGIWEVPVAKDGVAPIISMSNPYFEQLVSQGIDPGEFLKVFTGDKPVVWGDLLGNNSSERIDVFVREEESGATDVWASFVYHNASELKGTRVAGDDEMIKSVGENPLAIGYCNLSYAFDRNTGERTGNIQIIPVDLDYDNSIERTEFPFKNLEEAHRSLWLGFYPDLLCRELTLGSMGKPSEEVVIEFIRYVLTEGQDAVKETGFCGLNNVYIQNSLDRLN